MVKIYRFCFFDGYGVGGLIVLGFLFVGFIEDFFRLTEFRVFVIVFYESGVYLGGVFRCRRLECYSFFRSLGLVIVFVYFCVLFENNKEEVLKGRF